MYIIQLLHVLKTRKVDEKELHGFKVSTRALEKLTPQEIRDLRDVFDVFDFYDKGYEFHISLGKNNIVSRKDNTILINRILINQLQNLFKELDSV